MTGHQLTYYSKQRQARWCIYCFHVRKNHQVNYYLKEELNENIIRISMLGLANGKQVDGDILRYPKTPHHIKDKLNDCDHTRQAHENN